MRRLAQARNPQPPLPILKTTGYTSPHANFVVMDSGLAPNGAPRNDEGDLPDGQISENHV
jgi:hypothetical protein